MTNDEIEALQKRLRDAQLYTILHGEAADTIAQLRAEVERLTRERDALKEQREDAMQSASETHQSWKHRCYSIMDALGLDYGDPNWEMPDEIKRAEAAERQVATLREALTFYSLYEIYQARSGMETAIWRDGFGGRARAAIAKTEKKDEY